jgi:AcrR family transcriptional regulator
MTTKREKNAARIKYNVLEYVLEESRSRNFSDIQVIEICEFASISKVTFFKYFTQKEDIILYYKSVFTLRLIIAIEQQELEGMKALNYIVHEFAIEYTSRPSLILGLIHYFTGSTQYVNPTRVKPAERDLIFKDVDDTIDYEIISFAQLIEQLMLDVVFQKQSAISSDPKYLSEIFISTLYGGLVVFRMKNLDNISMFLYQILGAVFPAIKA